MHLLKEPWLLNQSIQQFSSHPQPVQGETYGLHASANPAREDIFRFALFFFLTPERAAIEDIAHTEVKADIFPKPISSLTFLLSSGNGAALYFDKDVRLKLT